MKTFAKWVFVIFGVILVIGVLAGLAADPSPPPTAAERAELAAKEAAGKEAARAEEKKAADEKARKERNFQFTVLLAKSIRESVRDPDSLVWEGITANDDSSIVCFQFRAKNGFGGYNRESATYANGKLGQSAASWNKHCAKKVMNDMIAVKHAL
jgi:hypothetical protein